MTNRYGVALLALALAVGCRAPDEPTPIRFATAFLLGRVDDASGHAITGANVEAFAFRGDCGALERSNNISLASTDRDGAFSLPIGEREAGAVCVTVRVTPPAGAIVRDTTISGTRLELAWPGTAAVLDTVRLAIRLAAKP